MEIAVGIQKEYKVIVQRVVESFEELWKCEFGTEEYEVAHEEMEAANEAQIAFLQKITEKK